jgi:hypothetical protein
MQGRRPTYEDEVRETLPNPPVTELLRLTNACGPQVVVIDDMNTVMEVLSKHINRAFYAVFDGHAGAEAAKLAAELLPSFVLCPRCLFL